MDIAPRPIVVDGEDITQSNLWLSVSQLVFLESRGILNMPLAAPITTDEDEHYALLISKYLNTCNLLVTVDTIGTVKYLVLHEVQV